MNAAHSAHTHEHVFLGSAHDENAKRNASNSRYSFGTGKVGDLGGFASALILALVSLGIGVESVIRLLQPTEVQFGTATLIAVVGLAVNIVSALLLGHGHSHGHDHDHDPHGHDNNMRSAYGMYSPMR